MTSWLHEQVRMAEVLPRKESPAQAILPWQFAPLDLGEPLQQGTPVSRIHADSAQRQTGEIVLATVQNPCLGRPPTPNPPKELESREVRVVPREKGEAIVR